MNLNMISHPVTTIQGEMSMPGDKSISHRAILLGSIAQGITSISHFLDGDDCLATIAACRAMGVHIEGPTAQQVVIHGVGKYGLKKPKHPIDCGNSGTSMRLLAGLLAAQCFDSELIGDGSLQKRPMNRIAHPLKQMGAWIETTEGQPPLTMRGGRQLNGISYEMPQASAQVKSCLLLAGMYADGETTIIEPETTRDHTERMLETFSYPLRREDSAVIIDSRHACIGASIQVPGDLSSAAFFIVAATLIPGAHLIIRNVGLNPTRTGVIDILKLMGAHIQIDHERYFGTEPVADLIIQYAPLQGIEIPSHLVSLAIDEFPILFIAAACAKGATILRGAQELRCKESDRIGAMAEGLHHLGIEAIPQEDGIIIYGGRLSGGIVNSYYDHRIAMAFAIAGTVAKTPITILNCHQVSTSFPRFAEVSNQIGMNITMRFR